MTIYGHGVHATKSFWHTHNKGDGAATEQLVRAEQVCVCGDFKVTLYLLHFVSSFGLAERLARGGKAQKRLGEDDEVHVVNGGGDFPGVTLMEGKGPTSEMALQELKAHDSNHTSLVKLL